MERKNLIGILAIVAVIAIVYIVLGWTSTPQASPEFAQCLTDKGAVMYGTDWCPHCKDQKEMFGDAFEYINYVNCDYNKVICTAEDIRGYPTWMIGGMKYPGTKPLEKLAELSGCELDGG